MTSARAEWTGVGAALLFHVILIAAMSLSLAKLNSDPEPPSMQVDIVDEVALESMAPEAVSEPASPPPPPSETFPEPTPPQPTAPSPPTPRTVPQPSIKPTPPTPRQPQQRQPQQRQPQQRQPQRHTEQRQPPRRVGLGDDFLSKLDDSLAPRGAATPAAATFSATAKKSIAQSIADQAQRCANRQPYLGEGADEVVMSLTLNFSPSGRLVRPPRITNASGPAEARAKYGDLLEDQIRRIFTECAPFRLPADLYDTDSGGWKTTTLRYKVKK